MQGKKTFRFNRQRLIELQKRHSLKDAEFARKAGLTRQQFQQWKAGITRPNTASLASIANAFGVDINYFFTVGQYQNVIQGPAAVGR